MENKPELNVVSQEEKTPKQPTEKELKKRKEYMNSMIRRGEAIALINNAAKRNLEAIQEPLQTTLVANMALQDILVQKGLVTHEEVEQQSKFILQELQRPVQDKDDSSDAGKENEEENK